MLQALTFTNPSKLMSDVAISVENISKCYRIGTQGGPAYHRLSEMITGVPQALWNAGKSLVRKSSIAAGAVPDVQNTGEFWALKDVSFEIKQGEVVGIIGRNGAGKSTLLKILSRITEPTSGRFGVRGRVASLLEVGTGFHPELTGRENIYVSGITLGMTRAEIKKRFDEIVDFSGVEKFLDTPVKHYSSGMQVRLGFSVAAHLESEILIVDEVLAVGDADYQRKCLSRMRELAEKQYRTVVIVSHNSHTITAFTRKCVWLQNALVYQSGDTHQIMKDYARYGTDESQTHLIDHTNRKGSGIARFLSFKLISAEGEEIECVSTGARFGIRLELESRQDIEAEIALGIDDAYDTRVTTLSSTFVQSVPLRVTTGRNYVNIDVPRMALAPGRYTVTLFMAVDDVIADWIVAATRISVLPGNFFPTDRHPSAGQGTLLLDHTFRVGDGNAS